MEFWAPENRRCFKGNPDIRRAWPFAWANQIPPYRIKGFVIFHCTLNGITQLFGLREPIIKYHLLFSLTVIYGTYISIVSSSHLDRSR